jgi:hypothetical protein
MVTTDSLAFGIPMDMSCVDQRPIAAHSAVVARRESGFGHLFNSPTDTAAIRRLLTSARHCRCGVDGATRLWVFYVSWEKTAVTPDERLFRFAVELGAPHSGDCTHRRFRNVK